MGKYTRELNDRLEITDKAHYHREQYQSFMTGPEWRNVEMAEEYGAFIRDGKSMFQFPYFRQILDLWKVVYNSYSSARQYNSPRQIIFSEYMMMDIFVGFFTTIELIPKGFLSLLLYPFLKKENQSPIQAAIADYYEKYATDLQTIPFYDHHYKEIRNELKQKYLESENRTWVDWFSWKCVSIELLARRWISKPLSYWFHQEDNLVPATTDILVKFDAYDVDDADSAKELFNQKIAGLGENVTVVDDHIYVKENQTKDYISVYARLSAPRYAAFQPAIKALANEGIHLRKIAGQDKVQVKCVIDAPHLAALETQREVLNQTKKVSPLYTYSDRIHPNRQVCLFDVPTRNLHKTLHRFEKEDDVEVKFIHNF